MDFQAAGPEEVVAPGSQVMTLGYQRRLIAVMIKNGADPLEAEVAVKTLNGIQAEFEQKQRR
jgi:hypothetical protein